MQDRNQPQAAATVQATPWGSTDADLSQHGSLAWSEASPVKTGMSSATGSWDAANPSASPPLRPFHKSPSIQRPGGTGLQVSSSEAPELSVPSSLKVTALSRQGTREDAAVKGGFADSQKDLHSHPARRNLSADLQAITDPSGNGLSSHVLPPVSKGSKSALPSAAQNDWWAPAKPGQDWADDEESVPLPQPASQLPLAKTPAAGTGFTSEAAAAFAGLSLGHASDKQLSSSTASNDTAGPASSSSSFADTTSSRPTGVPGLIGLGATFLPPKLAGAWPTNTEGQQAVNGLSGAKPCPPQRMFGMGEAPVLSLERDSSSGTSSRGFAGPSPVRQGSSGTVACTARYTDDIDCLQLTSTCPKTFTEILPPQRHVSVGH